MSRDALSESGLAEDANPCPTVGDARMAGKLLDLSLDGPERGGADLAFHSNFQDQDTGLQVERKRILRFDFRVDVHRGRELTSREDFGRSWSTSGANGCVAQVTRRSSCSRRTPGRTSRATGTSASCNPYANVLPMF